MRSTSDWMYKLGVVDTVVNEPVGGAHRDTVAAIDALGDALRITRGKGKTSNSNGTNLGFHRFD